MSAYQHKRNFSLLATQSQTSAKLKSTNRSLRKIQNNNVNNHSWLLVAARQYYHKTNNLTSAIESFQQYLVHNPSHQQSLYLCSICYMHINEYEKAIKKLKQYINEKKSASSSLINPMLGNRKLIIHSHSQLPQINHAYLLLSIAYNKINNVGKALETINQVLKLDTKYQEGYCFRAKLYRELGDFQKACFDYKQVLKCNQGCWQAWIGLGDYYTQTNNYQQAYKCYIKAKQCSTVRNKPQTQTEQQQQRKIFQKQQSRYTEKSASKHEQRKTQRMHEKLSQFLKKPKRVTQFSIPIQKQSSQIQKIRPKMNIRTITSPTHQSNQLNPLNAFSLQSKQEMNKRQKLFFHDNFSNEALYNRDLLMGEAHITKQIEIKQSICLYYLGQHNKSLQLLQSLKQQKGTGSPQYWSQIYYYMSANQLKQYESIKAQMLKSPQTSQNRECAELLEKIILNLQTSIKAANNPKIMTKSCKNLIKLYIQNNQFYQTSGVIQLALKYGIDVKEYQVLSEACMLVIKQKYEQALPIFKRLLTAISSTSQAEAQAQHQSSTSGKLTQLHEMSTRQKKKEKYKPASKQKQKCSSMRLSTKNREHGLSAKKNKNQVQKFQKLQIQFGGLSDEEQHQRNQLIVSTGNDRKIVKKHIQPPIQQDSSNQFKNLHLQNLLLQTPSVPVPAPGHPHSSQLQWMMPIILLFRAYAEYFSDNFIECLQVYEHYENYIKDYLGKEPQTDVYLSYNKVMCQGILMIDNQMIQESIEKFVICVENYYKLLKGVAVEPILFRILALIRLALSENPYISQQINSRSKIYLLIIEIIDHYLPAISNNPLVYYYYGLALYQLERYKQASDYLEKCLKIAEECTWKFLYVKGVIQIKNKLYKDAVKEFSAGLLVQERAQLYLGRCICYIQLFDQSNCQHQSLMQKSFEDLQKFIELEDNKQKISKWVTKVLFFNKAYEQVSKSIKKVSNQTLENDDDLVKIQKNLNIYNGNFEDGGVLGQVIINAFQGKFEDTSVEINEQRHQIILSDFVSSKYKKWLHILNLYSGQRYNQLIKYLQVSIFQEKSQEEAFQLRYNLAVVYYLSQEASKADNVLAGLVKHMSEIQSRVQKFLNRDFMLDECVDDLQRQLKGIRRLSSFLPYRKVALNSKVLLTSEPSKSIYVRISIPFPEFFKPNIDLDLDEAFIYGETAQTCIPKRIQAPWIKRVTGHVQFTDNLISSQNTSIFEQDVLSAAVESKEESESMPSSIKHL